MDTGRRDPPPHSRRQSGAALRFSKVARLSSRTARGAAPGSITTKARLALAPPGPDDSAALRRTNVSRAARVLEATDRFRDDLLWQPQHHLREEDHEGDGEQEHAIDR